ncbi:MAG: thrombospondin type 3 repeat-containing protein, partial [Myxococcota bacterium]
EKRATVVVTIDAGETLDDFELRLQTAGDPAWPGARVLATTEGEAGKASLVHPVSERVGPYIVELRSAAVLGEQARYTLTLQASAGTLVGPLYVTAVLAEDGHPAFFPDPVSQPKLPLGAVAVAPNAWTRDEEGNLRAEFSGLRLPPSRVSPGAKVNLFAWADNDRSGDTAPLDLLHSPLTRVDFISSRLVEVTVPAFSAEVATPEIVLDSFVLDQDLDGFFEEDTNGDGVIDDNCPGIPNTTQADIDGDGVGDACDNCPDRYNPAQLNTDGEGRGDECNDDPTSQCPWWLGVYPHERCGSDLETDSERDEVEATTLRCVTAAPCRPEDAVEVPLDNCPEGSNATQVDTDSDGQGDACDEDDDGDGIADAVDNCPSFANPRQENADGDAVGDACDLCPTQFDLFPFADLDGDGVGDRCDTDRDNDGWCNDENAAATPAADCAGVDNCPETHNPEQMDMDGDGDGDACDLCPSRALDSQEDSDGDGIGDDCDECERTIARISCVADADCATAGGTCLEGGQCISESDGDHDGTADDCDDDRDGDGVLDGIDVCRELYDPAQGDRDHDGIGDACDICPDFADADQLDSDGDGVGDACDRCPAVPAPAPTCRTDDDCRGAGGFCALSGRCAYDADTDGDGQGDACDPDDDDDGVCDPCDPAAALYR